MLALACLPLMRATPTTADRVTGFNAARHAQAVSTVKATCQFQDGGHGQRHDDPDGADDWYNECINNNNGDDDDGRRASFRATCLFQDDEHAQRRTERAHRRGERHGRPRILAR